MHPLQTVRHIGYPVAHAEIVRTARRIVRTDEHRLRRIGHVHEVQTADQIAHVRMFPRYRDFVRIPGRGSRLTEIRRTQNLEIVEIAHRVEVLLEHEQVARTAGHLERPDRNRTLRIRYLEDTQTRPTVGHVRIMSMHADIEGPIRRGVKSDPNRRIGIGHVHDLEPRFAVGHVRIAIVDVNSSSMARKHR